ncbi:MAG: Enoyl-CoA-hydratase [Alphaproteobacteria bacterium MarineAlpha11_Bin1]|nr:MAG: Enoyl-CoA-hydratase [Alphaproteobacteria bacterium MarineAlpha11_Bin1]|tara:strand:- start:8438 stop:9229 length:792 start_codon:yes stop_codon:yes gene_type:complete
MGKKEDENILLRSDVDGIATLSLNRPHARNALSRDLMSALQTELDQISTDDNVRVVVIAAVGPAFCAGHDLRELRVSPRRATYEALFAQCSKLMLSITRIPQPVIAKVQATATAAGCQLVATCDLAIAADTAKFATPGVNIGLFCSTPMVAVSRNIGRKRMMEMLLTGEMIDSEMAESAGLINSRCPAEELTDVVDRLCKKISSKSALTLRIGKEAFHRQLDMPLEDAYAYTSEAMVINMMANDAEEGIDAFLEKRSPVWLGK